MSAEQTELRTTADDLERFGGRRWAGTVDLLRRAADRLDRLTALLAGLEENGDA